MSIEFASGGRAAAHSRSGLPRSRLLPTVPSPDAVVSVSGLSLAFRDGVPDVSKVRPGAAYRVKRAVDIVVATAAIVALSPLLVGVALAIKLTSRGPVLFRQSRVGFRGVPFDILKFRSLRVDQCDASGVDQVRERDDRCTPVGRFLRQSSLDELPQLINILRGDMSLVGPRPHVPGQLAAGAPYEELVPYYSLRTMARPGLTGWAQANGLRGPTRDADKATARIQHDLAYLQNMSLALDLRIILKTVRQEALRRTGS